MQTIMDLVKKYGIYILAFYLLKSMFKKRKTYTGKKYSIAGYSYKKARTYGGRGYGYLKQRYNKFRGR